MLALGCGGSSGSPAPVPRTAADPAAPGPAAGVDDASALPAELPERLEIELRRRTEAGDDVVLKLTPVGARYGVAHGKARVALSFPLDPDGLAGAYATLRREGFDRIETAPGSDAPLPGTSMRVTAGPARHSVGAMGRQAPLPEHADAYARCVTAVESLLPQGTGAAVLHLRWDPALAEQATALDLDAGDAFAGLRRVDEPDGAPHFALHLTEPRTLQVRLRSGTPPQSSTLTVPAAPDSGLRVTLGPDGAAVLQPWSPAGAAAPAP